MRALTAPVRSEQGIALVVALLVLLVLSMLAVVLMTSVTVESKITGHSTREASALNVAEAGIAEALSQIRAGNASLNLNPRAVVQVFNTTAGSVPVLGADSTAIATAQPAGQWLSYSTATRGPNVLTIQYRTDAARSVIYKYDSSEDPAIQTTSGFPIFRVTSTGVEGVDSRQVVAEFIQKPIDVLAKGAVVADVGVNLSGASVVCGFNHNIDTPAGTGAGGRTGVGGCAEDNSIQHWELSSGHMPGVWTSDTTTIQGAANPYGNPATANNQTGFYAGPWSVFNMTQSAFFSWMGPPVWPEPANPTGVLYVDNNGTTQDKSANAAYQGGDGEGLLYVDGDLTINGNFTFRGLVYIEGDLKINGTAWILGGLVVKGITEIKIANGNCTVLYSGDAIQQKISQYGGQFVNISWREP